MQGMVGPQRAFADEKQLPALKCWTTRRDVLITCEPRYLRTRLGNLAASLIIYTMYG
jgi:hypothetical protein